MDDHELIRDALIGLLGAFDEVDDVQVAASAREAKRVLGTDLTIGLVLLDLILPDCDGMAFLRSIRADHPEIPVVVLSASESRGDMTSALEAGASGFIPKSARNEVMKSALKLVFAGGIYVPPEILSPARAISIGPVSPLALKRLELTERQIEVLQQMMQGKSNKEICRKLDIAEPTVKNHVTAILRTLGTTNRTEAVLAATALLESNKR